MKNNNLPISLSQILIKVLDPEFDLTHGSLNELTFDDRRDFILPHRNQPLAVRMVFANERCDNGKCTPGIRRKVIVSLIDSTNHKLYTSTTLSLNIMGRCFSHTANVSIAVDFNEINFDHPYSVIVRDEKSGKLLGQRQVRFFLPYHIGNPVTELFLPFFGGLKPSHSDELYLSCKARLMNYHHVEFHLLVYESASLPAFIPEMQVKIYFPDGSVESRCVDSVTYKDANDDDTYLFSAPFLMTESKRGICYARLTAFDKVIAGIVFNTDGDDISGATYYENLTFIDEYSLEEVSGRYRKLIGYEPDDEPDDQPCEITDDDLDNAINEFIKSQLEPDAPTGPEDSEDSEDSTETEESPVEPDRKPAQEETVSPLKSLENLTGLHSVKEKLTAYEKLVIFNKKRQECDLPTLTLPLHAMFCGSPGTGKTTVAKRMGLMLRRAGVLSRGNVVIKERSTLIGKHYGDEETNTRAAIEEAQGGILFIDEAYQLYQPNDPKDPGKFVIETLMTALADESNRDWMLILAGYTEDMKRMFEMNPGLRSRIPDSNIYIFDDFSESELMEIAERYLERHRFSMTDEARSSLASRLGDDYHHRDKSFGNARHVINMIQSEILPSMASRVVSSNNFDPSALSMIQSCDIPRPQNLTRPNRPLIGYRA